MFCGLYSYTSVGIGRSRNEHLKVDPPTVHIASYVTGGLKRLYQRIHSNSVPKLHGSGVITDRKFKEGEYLLEYQGDQILYREAKRPEEMYDYGYYTAENGHFQPSGKCVVALRYMVTSVLHAKGQSAVLVMAEDLFNNKKKVIIKVLHVQFYELGLQESHCLLGLRVADPHNYSHTLMLLATFTVDGHYCMVFDPLLPDPLTSIFQEIPQHYLLSSIKKVALRLLASVGFLHQQNLIHADLKPENILLKDRSDLDSVHVVDFGNALNYVHREVSLYYNDFELQTPLYRAPEVMFGLPFGTEIDMWSIGCILAELYMGKPLFLGNRKEDILQEMTQLLGPLPSHIFQRGKFFPKFKQYTGLSSQCQVENILRNHLHCRDLGFVSFLAGLLHYDPDVRLTVSEAARHPFLAGEFPVAYLFSQSHDKPAGYSAVLLNTVIYQSSPAISPDIQKRQPSSIELLRLGTSSSHDPPWMAVVDPIQKHTSPEKGRLVRLNSNHSSQDQGLRNMSQSSKCDMNISIGSSSHNPERTSWNSSGVLVRGEQRIEGRHQLKELMNSIHHEQALVEEDLRWSAEQQQHVHRGSVFEGRQLNQIVKGKQLHLNRNSNSNMDTNSTFSENVIIKRVPNDGHDRPKNRTDVLILEGEKNVNYRPGSERSTETVRNVSSEEEYEKQEMISGNVNIDRKSFCQRSISKTGKKHMTDEHSRSVSYTCKSESWIPNHNTQNLNPNSEDKVILQRHNQRRMVPVSQDTCVSVKHEGNEETVNHESIEDRRDKLINAKKSKICRQSPRYDISKSSNQIIMGKDRKSLRHYATDLQNSNQSVQPLDIDIVYNQCKIASPGNETFILKEKINPCRSKQRKVTPSKREIIHSGSKRKFKNNSPYKEVGSRIDDELEEIEILSPKHSLGYVPKHKELVSKRGHICDEDMHHISDKRAKIEDKSRALKQSIKQNISSSSSKYMGKEKLERRATSVKAAVSPNLHEFDGQIRNVRSSDLEQTLNVDESWAINSSHPGPVSVSHELDFSSANFSGTRSFGEENFERSSLQHANDREIHLNSTKLKRSFITIDSRNASQREAEFAKRIRTCSSDRNSLEECHDNEKTYTCNYDPGFLRSQEEDLSCREMEQKPTSKRSLRNEQTPDSFIHRPEGAMLDEEDEYSNESFSDSEHSANDCSEVVVKDKCIHEACSSSSSQEESLKSSEVEPHSNKAEIIIQRSSFEKDSDINQFSPTGSKNLLKQGKPKKNMINARGQVEVQRRKVEIKNSAIHDPYYFHGSEEKIRANVLTDQQNSERLLESTRFRGWSDEGSNQITFTDVKDNQRKFSREPRRRLTYDKKNRFKSLGPSNTLQKNSGKKLGSGRTCSVESDVTNDNSNNRKFCSESLKRGHLLKKSCPSDNNVNKIKSSVGNVRRRNSNKSSIKFTEGYGKSTFIHQESGQERHPKFSDNAKVRSSLDETYTLISQTPLELQTSKELHTDTHLRPSDDELEIQSECSGQSGFSFHRNNISQQADYSDGVENQSTQSQKSEFNKEVGNLSLLTKQSDSVGTNTLHNKRFNRQGPDDISAEVENETGSCVCNSTDQSWRISEDVQNQEEDEEVMLL